LRAHPGLRVPGCWDGFEMAVRAVLGQQVSVKGASTMAGRVAAEFGAPALADGHARATNREGGLLFPTAKKLAGADLSRVGVTRQRANSIRDLAQAVVSGEVQFDGAIEPEEFERRITRIKGIGAWTAQYIAMRLGEPDAFPAADLYLRRAGRDSELWRPWRAYAAMYIWKGNVGKPPKVGNGKDL
jgi:AraC family transcriptional regulator of adaptative response / DNA-3-methyladenine glycosylase II